ncbi:MAG: septum formation protein Maf [Alphaproteobacteria bacterium]|nr:septum formation protein Maf [Alphaproteobacteria bacterium]
MAQNTSRQRLVLASQSPVRAQLLRNAGLDFETCPAHVDEAALIAASSDPTFEQIALCLAKAKAMAVIEAAGADVVIAADQLLVCDGVVLHKPVDLDAARARLELLSGRTHELVTACVLARAGTVLWTHSETSRLTMHALSDAEIDETLALEGQAVLQSVGAYRLEGPGIALIAALEGDYFAMLGLPLVPLLAAIRRHAAQFLPGAGSK